MKRTVKYPQETGGPKAKDVTLFITSDPSRSPNLLGPPWKGDGDNRVGCKSFDGVLLLLYFSWIAFAWDSRWRQDLRSKVCSAKLKSSRLYRRMRLSDVKMAI
jgi:hypothetical protein